MPPTGRPRAMDDELKSMALRLAGEGLSRKRMAERLGLSAVTVRREAARDQSFGLQLRTAEVAARRGAFAQAEPARLMRQLVDELRLTLNQQK